MLYTGICGCMLHLHCQLCCVPAYVAACCTCVVSCVVYRHMWLHVALALSVVLCAGICSCMLHLHSQLCCVQAYVAAFTDISGSVFPLHSCSCPAGYRGFLVLPHCLLHCTCPPTCAVSGDEWSARAQSLAEEVLYSDQGVHVSLLANTPAAPGECAVNGYSAVAAVWSATQDLATVLVQANEAVHLPIGDTGQ